MNQQRSAYLRGGNVRLLAVALALPLALLVLSLGPVRRGAKNAREEMRLRQEQIHKLEDGRIALARLDPDAQARARAFWSALQGRPPVALEDALEELVARVEGAGAERASAVPQGAASETQIQPLTASSPDGDGALALDPQLLRLSFESDPRRLAPVLDALAEPGLPLRVERVTVERAGPSLHADVDLVFFVTGDPA